MRLNCNSFFDGDFNFINLNHFYLRHKHLIADNKNPQHLQQTLNTLGKNTYGGYAEDRRDIWHGSYLDNHQNYIHLGIDINIAAGFSIRCPFDANVVDIFTDTDTKIGWGGRLILKQNDSPYLILAHINPTTLINKSFVKKGEYLGAVGTWPTNGNVFEHLHVQAVKHLNFNTLDGYGYVHDLHNNPDPFQIDFL